MVLTFSAQLERTGAVAVLRLAGDLDLATREQLGDVLRVVRRGSLIDCLIMDFRGLTFLDAAGVAPLVQMASAVLQSGGDRTVAVGATPEQALILSMTPIIELGQGSATLPSAGAA